MKQLLKVGARSNTPKNLSRNHYTTLGFGHIYPIYIDEFMNGSKLNFKVSNFSRIAPQFLPNLGTLNMKVHAFYVPFNLVWNHFEHFQMGLPSWNNHGSQVYKFAPSLCDCDFTSMFVNSTSSSNPLCKNVSDTTAPFDFSIVNNTSGIVSCYQFTPFGKYVYHVFNALGYNFKFMSWTYLPDYENHVEKYSLLPLLCYFKAYLDYFIPSQLQPSSYLHRLLLRIHDLTALETYNMYHLQGGSVLRQDIVTDIADFLNEMYYYYQNNYFTSAWMSPNEVVPGLNNIGKQDDKPIINSITSQGLPSASQTPLKIQPLDNQPNGILNMGSTSLTADGITFMQKFARFIKRSNFAGSRTIERVLSTFGVRISDFEGGMCKYLGSDTFVMNSTDVTVTGDTQQAGNFVGKSWIASNSERQFKCDCDLYGMLIITASMETPSTFLEGVRKRNKHLQPLDFYNPDMDGSVFQAISGNEVFNRVNYMSHETLDDLNIHNLDNNSTFGYQMRYMEFKTALDDISGDFAVPTLAKNIDNFILPRKLFDNIAIHDDAQEGELNIKYSEYAYSDDLKDTTNPVPVTPVFALKGDDMGQFNRIFRQTDGSSDPIYSVFRIDIVANNCVIPANVSAELDGKGKEIEFETNGVHV